MKDALLTPPPESILWENEHLYVCLASYPITRGHTVVVWKNAIPDLRALPDAEYEILMEIVDVTRDALLQTLKVEKVYLMYLDEAKHVHWHLVPRYGEKGFDVFTHAPEKTEDFSLVPELRSAFIERLKTYTS